MLDLPPGWATDLAILELSGSTIEDHSSHRVIRTPDNPNFHWGNFVFVTDEAAVDDAERWTATCRQEFPDATWTAIGLIREPADQEAWAAQGVELQLDQVMTTRVAPQLTALPEGYTARQFGPTDWEQSVARSVAENRRTQEYEPSSYERFERAHSEARRRLSERGLAGFFGAFVGGVLAAELGVVRCGRTARYQAVGTDPEHRRRGLASHLLGVAARWAADRGCHQWVIVTEATNPAGRVYRRVGFRPDVGNAQAYRRPPR